MSTVIATQHDHRVRHLIALALGVLSVSCLLLVDSYVVAVVVGVIAVVVGHRAVVRSGPYLWAAIVGLALSYLGLVFAAALVIVRVTRVLV